MFQNDLKGLLAYSTISHLGLITLLLGLNSPLAAVAAVFHMMNHATFKASLFMAVGIIDHETGTRDMRRLRRPVPLHADHRHAGHGGVRRDGRRAAAQRLPVQGNVLRRDGVRPGPALGRMRAAGRWPRWPACSRWSIRCASATTCSSARRRSGLPRKPHEPVRWMRVPIELAGAGLPGGGHRARLVDRRRAARGGRPGGGRQAARLQPGGLAWLHHAAGDEPGRAAGRHPGCTWPTPGASSSAPRATRR